MYKVLITTCAGSPNNASVHTIVVEFSTPEDAERAMQKINDETQIAKAWVEQFAVRLF